MTLLDSETQASSVFILHILPLCQNLAPTLPTMHLYQSQFSQRFRCVMIAAANIALRHYPKAVVSSVIQMFFYLQLIVFRPNWSLSGFMQLPLEPQKASSTYAVLLPKTCEQTLIHRPYYFNTLTLLIWAGGRTGSQSVENSPLPLTVSLMTSPGRMSELEIWGGCVCDERVQIGSYIWLPQHGWRIAVGLGELSSFTFLQFSHWIFFKCVSSFHTVCLLSYTCTLYFDPK